MNRAVYRFNDKADMYVMKPVAEGYRTVAPQPVRTSVRNFFSNLNDASSSVNYALQIKPAESFYSFARVVLNSTVGVAGLFDVTGEKQRHYPQTDFGETLARWGWKNSSYLVLPLLGPSTLRDGMGEAAELWFRHDVLYNDPHEDRLLISNSVSAISAREGLLGLEDSVKGAALDPYAYVRDGWLQMRAKKTGDDAVQASGNDAEDIDTLMQ